MSDVSDLKAELLVLKAENAKLRELVKDLLNAWDDMQHEVVTGPAFDDCECRAYELGIEVDV